MALAGLPLSRGRPFFKASRTGQGGLGPGHPALQLWKL
jgi:hypothetical protein